MALWPVRLGMRGMRTDSRRYGSVARASQAARHARHMRRQQALWPCGPCQPGGPVCAACAPTAGVVALSTGLRAMFVPVWRSPL